MEIVEKYLQSYDDYFWQYEDEGSTIAVPNGSTIAYSDLIVKEILPALAPQGLPRFGSLLLALVATNSHGAFTIGCIRDQVYRRGIYDSSEVTEGIEFTQLLTQLPDGYKKGNSRLELLRAIFQDSHKSTRIKKSLRIAKQLMDNPDLITTSSVQNKIEISDHHLITDYRVLGLIGRKLKTVDDILTRIAGLPPMEIEIEELELKPAYYEDGFVGELQQNDETYYVGALVTRLMSGLQIPFHSSLPSEQPLGGVSDITNKGSFDKLLMSEYAYDDQILLSRLANNESLYHHREVPPADNNYSRIILIDNTLNNWGTIKTISHAAMLAITNHPKSKNPCRVFLIGKDYKEVKFNTVDEVIEGLQILDSSLDPGVGLLKLFTEESIERSEIFYIGTPENLEMLGMHKFNSEFGKRIDHWIHPNSLGEISIYKNPKRGKRFIQEIKLPLNKLWIKTKSKKKEITTYADYEYPILFPSCKFKDVWVGENYAYAVTRNRALIRMYGNGLIVDKGWEIVSTNLQVGDLLRAVMTHEDLTVTALVLKRKNEYDLINLPSNERTPISIARSLTRFYVSEEQFICSSFTSTFCVDKLGKVTKKQHEIEKYDKKQVNTNLCNVYRNIKKISITDSRQLRLGSQDLVLSDSKLNLAHTGSTMKYKAEATLSDQGEFVFPDGSTIRHNTDGILSLTSSDRSLAKIYIPSVLYIPLGVAASNHFAGNDYFQMESKFEIILSEYEQSKMSILKAIKSHLGGVSLKLAKEMTDSGIISWNDEDKIKALQTELDKLQIPYTHRRRGISQDIIGINAFYVLYIEQFINQILEYGTDSAK